MRENSFLRIFKFMKKLLIPYTFGLLVLSIFGLLLQVFISLIFKDMFDAIAIKEWSMLIYAVKQYGIYVILMFVIYPVFLYMAHYSAAITTGNIRKNVFSKVKVLPLSYIKGKHSGDLISRLTNDINEVEKAYSSYFIKFSSMILMGIGTLIFTFILEWRLGILSLIFGLTSLLVNINYAKVLKNMSAEVQESLSRLNERLTDVLESIHIIRSFNIASVILGKYNKANEEAYDISCSRVNKKAMVSTINNIIGIITFVGTVAVGAYLAIKGYISIGIIIAAVQLQNGVSSLAQGLGDFISELQGSLAAADRLFEILDEEEEPVSFDAVISEDIEDDSAIGFYDVSFEYGNKKVLDNLSFTVPKGKVYALAGPSGGGKSTIFKLLLNFYPSNEGNITINGKFISNQKIRDIRSNIAYVPQDAYLFSGTIMDNIKQGKEDATRDEIVNAAKMANAHDFIINMEDGYDTLVGEKGTKLSGGQRQRIAIARAILKDATILLLDEATSALDTESEKLVQEALNKLMIGRTTLIIAHRLSTIEDADNILVLKEGEIAEIGTHEELLELNGIYEGLYAQQFSN
ncbi:ABC transporter ATP-binding protein [Proteiniborus sp. MB09-C3]|uniref:ABC transporter ATP-binding protein n=1 Tax=Proteiniborus sp. MB09-C3 TaxID=3050072 RepID=UPI00255248ED|nr:ABC transporter ATP-binding protein [Proteiniborus sp. MB09-C3]WIV11759.1 ABC transporter ATP-binding protein [Proteiniborus sp. MB09-C3]